MRIIFIKVAFVIAVALISAVNVFNVQKSETLSDVALANVEALASGESSSETTWICNGSIGSCGAECGVCGTKISPSVGQLSGYHKCNKN